MSYSGVFQVIRGFETYLHLLSSNCWLVTTHNIMDNNMCFCQMMDTFLHALGDNLDRSTSSTFVITYNDSYENC